jgi:c-di-GMP-binding flagellar brake protein YcgR
MLELRNYQRVSFLCKLELTALPDGTPQPARSLDLSLGGVGAITQAVFPVGQLLRVLFFFKDSAQGEIQDQADGRVARFAADAEANTVGIQFLSPLNEAEHPRLVGKLLSF